MENLADLVGPFYDAPTAARLLPDPLHLRQDTSTLLTLTTADGLEVFPTWQFTSSGLLPEIPPLLVVFAASPPWSVALWFVTEDPLLASSPLEWIRASRPFPPLLTAARRTAREWQ